MDREIGESYFSSAIGSWMQVCAQSSMQLPGEVHRSFAAKPAAQDDNRGSDLRPLTSDLCTLNLPFWLRGLRNLFSAAGR